MAQARVSKEGFIGVFDSGLGGISVLKALVKELPGESFVYYGDSAHNPYGEKTFEQILGYSRQIVSKLLDDGAKAIVIACNTATSVAAATLRTELPGVSIVGVEPALKPAAEAHPHGRILVMATPVTLRLAKFHHLAEEYASGCEVVAVPCEGLAHRIEQGNLDAPDLLELLYDLVGEYRGGIDAVVLGCTHYPFAERQIRAVLGDVPFFDGSVGTARHLHDLLEQDGLLGPGGGPGTVAFESSLAEQGVLERYQEFFDLKL